MGPDTKDIARRIAWELCELQSEPHAPETVSATSLVFPSYRLTPLNRRQRARVSEAEARVLFCLALGNLKTPFAVEVPTTQQYAFSGTTQMSARTDLVIYTCRADDPQELTRNVAIEFKAHNPRVEAIRKDLEKLLREQCDGLWFHVLRDADSRTIPALLAKFTRAIGDLRDIWRQCLHTLSISVVVKEKRLWLYRILVPVHDSTPDLSIDYEIRGKEAVITDARGWSFEAF